MLKTCSETDEDHSAGRFSLIVLPEERSAGHWPFRAESSKHTDSDMIYFLLKHNVVIRILDILKSNFTPCFSFSTPPLQITHYYYTGSTFPTRVSLFMLTYTAFISFVLYLVKAKCVSSVSYKRRTEKASKYICYTWWPRISEVTEREVRRTRSESHAKVTQRLVI